MPVIRLSTQINAPIEIVFDLARSIDLHLKSMTKSKETAIAGRTKGLIELGESVTWQAKHFGIVQRMEVRITAMQRPNSFTDEMLKGAFRSFRHVHTFENAQNGTLMIDEIHFESPFWVFGHIFNVLVLRRYLQRLIESRNDTLKEVAESKISSL